MKKLIEIIIITLNLFIIMNCNYCHKEFTPWRRNIHYPINIKNNNNEIIYDFKESCLSCVISITEKIRNNNKTINVVNKE